MTTKEIPECAADVAFAKFTKSAGGALDYVAGLASSGSAQFQRSAHGGAATELQLVHLYVHVAECPLHIHKMW